MESNQNYDSNESSIQNNEIKKWKLISLGLLILLISSFIYSIYTYRSNSETLKMLENKNKKEIISVVSEKDKINIELVALREEYESIKSLSESKDEQIFHVNKELESKKQEIITKQKEIEKILNKGSNSDAEIKKLKGLIADLKSQVENYKKEIEQLKVENQTLKIENNDLSTNLNQEKSKSKEQAEIINVGSTLNATGFKIEGIKVKKSGKEVESQRARKIKKIRVTFILDENKISKTENKLLYISVTLPTGNIASFQNSRSGTIELKDGQTIGYSDKINIMYQQGTKIPVSFDWEGENFEKGDYTFVVYQNGYKIGEGKTSLR